MKKTSAETQFFVDLRLMRSDTILTFCNSLNVSVTIHLIRQIFRFNSNVIYMYEPYCVTMGTSEEVFSLLMIKTDRIRKKNCLQILRMFSVIIFADFTFLIRLKQAYFIINSVTKLICNKIDSN